MNPSLLAALLAGAPAADRAETEAAVLFVAKRMGLATVATPAIRFDSRGMHLSHLGNLPGEARR